MATIEHPFEDKGQVPAYSSRYGSPGLRDFSLRSLEGLTYERDVTVFEHPFRAVAGFSAYRGSGRAVPL